MGDWDGRPESSREGKRHMEEQDTQLLTGSTVTPLGFVYKQTFISLIGNMLLTGERLVLGYKHTLNT